MRKLWFAIAICGLFCMPLFAEEYPTAEVYGGYQLSVPNLGENLNGFAAAAEYNLSPVMGVVADFGFAKDTINKAGYSIVNKNYSAMVGPRFSYRASKARAFGHILIGGIWSKSTLATTFVNLQGGVHKDKNFCFGVGGGLEVKLAEKIFVRPIQLDLIETYNTVYGAKSATWDSGLRYSAGMVYRIGSKGK
jgi:opacity protein-like surface antigen